MTKDMQEMMKTWRMGNVSEMPGNMSRKEMMMMEEMKKMKAKMRKEHRESKNYSHDIVSMARKRMMK